MPVIMLEHEGKQWALGDLARVHSLPYQVVYVRWKKGDRGSLLVRPRRNYVHRATETNVAAELAKLPAP